MNAPWADHERRRADLPALRSGTYLDTPSCGLLSSMVTAGAAQRTEALMHHGVDPFLQWHTEQKGALRDQVARSVNGTAEGVALVPGFSNGLMLLAPLLSDRGKVLCVTGDYPTIPIPFRVNGHAMVSIDPADDGSIPLPLIAAALQRERPGILAISHVQWSTGYALDLKAVAELCHAQGCWLLVDATQSWCAAPIDVQGMGIDILGASGYKWPLAGFGNGFFHLASHVVEALKQHTKTPVETLMPGHLDPVSFGRLQDALSTVDQLGIKAIAAHIRQLTDHAVQGLEARGVQVLGGKDPAHRAGILVMEGDAARCEALRAKGIRCMPRGKGIRIGPHWYNTKADVDALLKALDELRR